MGENTGETKGWTHANHSQKVTREEVEKNTTNSWRREQQLVDDNRDNICKSRKAEGCGSIRLVQSVCVQKRRWWVWGWGGVTTCTYRLLQNGGGGGGCGGVGSMITGWQLWNGEREKKSIMIEKR